MKFGNYFDEIIKVSLPYLKKQFSDIELQKIFNKLSAFKGDCIQDFVDYFNQVFCDFIKQQYQEKTSPHYDHSLSDFLKDTSSQIKIIWGDCYQVLKSMKSESIHLMVTSPPYYNARDYSTWDNLNDYFLDMEEIINECYRVLDNHRVFVFNVGDIYGNDRITTKSVWGKRRLPLGSYFIKLFEDIGFTFVDDYIWDKGEVQTQRHMHGDKPYPFYQYPINCYEHILIFHKHRLDKTRFPCPICGCLKVNDNTQSEIGLQSWECGNANCFKRSKSNRGKRFSLKTNITQRHHKLEYQIPETLIKKWRRDIIKFSPVIKINCKGQNIIGHTAPFPFDIPNFSIQYFTYPNEIVLDPFAGSFTTAIAASKLNRIGVGIELNKGLFRESVVKIVEKETCQADLYKKHIKYAEYGMSNLPKTYRQRKGRGKNDKY